MKELTDSADKVVVVIHADDQVSHGRVVTVMDRIRVIEGAKLAMQVSQVLVRWYYSGHLATLFIDYGNIK